MAPLNVLMVSTSYPADLQDWRGLFIRNLTDALSERDDLRISFWAPPGEVHAGIRRVCSASDDAWLSKLVRAGGIAQLLRRHPFHGALAGLGLLRRLRALYRRQLADVYHINWLQNALPLPQNNCPALVTVLGADMRLLALPGMKSLMRRICHHRRVAICPNADWMLPALTDAFGDIAAVKTIRFGIDPRWFSIERGFANEPTPQWVVVARVTQDKMGELFNWGEPVFKNQPRKLHLFGPLVEQMRFPDWITYHGPATPDDLRERWFPIASGLVTLSRHAEGRPQVMLEAMAAGLPIIATRLPAHEDLLRHRETGWLVNDAAEFEDAVRTLESADTNIAVGLAARARMQCEAGTWADCAARYAAAYRALFSAAPQ
jgi:glycosyltransferase involved in cell wall biosynthesis